MKRVAYFIGGKIKVGGVERRVTRMLKESALRNYTNSKEYDEDKLNVRRIAYYKKIIIDFKGETQ